MPTLGEKRLNDLGHSFEAEAAFSESGMLAMAGTSPGYQMTPPTANTDRPTHIADTALAITDVGKFIPIEPPGQILSSPSDSTIDGAVEICASDAGTNGRIEKATAGDWVIGYSLASATTAGEACLWRSVAPYTKA